MKSTGQTSPATVPQSAPPVTRIIGLFPQLLGMGGVQEAGRLTAIALSEIARRRECSIEILSLNDPPGINTLDVDECPISFRGFGRDKIRFTLAAMSQARSNGRNAAGIIVAGHPYLAVPARWAQRASRGFRIGVMSHGIEVWKTLPGFRRRALAHADTVFAPSSYTAKTLTEVQAIPRWKVRKLPWPLSPSFLRLAADPENVPLPPEFPQGRVVLTVGRWSAAERYKGADELIRAVAQLSKSAVDLHLVAVGSGDDLPRLRNLAADLSVVDRVHFLENLSRPQIAACYSRADIFALPSTGEGFGLVFIEAMAFAKPIIGAASGGITDVIEDGINGLLVSPHDTDGLTRVLDRLLRDEALCATLGCHGAEILRQKYRFEVFQAELERILVTGRLYQGSSGSA